MPGRRADGALAVDAQRRWPRVPRHEGGDLVDAQPDRVPQNPNGRARLVQPALGQCGSCVERIHDRRWHLLACRDRPHRLQLHREPGQGVREHVVHLAGDAPALAQRDCLCLRLAPRLDLGEQGLGAVARAHQLLMLKRTLDEQRDPDPGQEPDPAVADDRNDDGNGNGVEHAEHPNRAVAE